jgi:hypothetical protein
MARPTTKADLITAANRQFDKLWKLVDSMSEEVQTALFASEMAEAGKDYTNGEHQTHLFTTK